MDNPNTEYSRDVVGALKERADAPSMMAKHASAQKEASSLCSLILMIVAWQETTEL